MPEEEKQHPPKPRSSDRFLILISRFIVSLTWALLLAVVIFVVYLAAHFSQR